MENNGLGFKTLKEVMESWGENPHCMNHPTQPVLREWILDFLNDKATSFDLGTKERDVLEYYRTYAYHILERFQPAPSKSDSSQVAIYESRGKFDLDRRLTGKPGKMLRRMFPFALDSDCESFANWWRDTFKKTDLIIKEAKDSDTIAEVYQAPILEGFDMAYGPQVKPLNRSCMRYDCHYFGTNVHPTSVYGSGDFVLYWAETTEGKVASRVIASCHNGKVSAGPIYATNEQSCEVLLSYLESIKADREGNWHGARLLKIEHGSDHVIMPYLDCVQRLGDYDESFFVVANRGDIYANSTSGYIHHTGHEYTCDGCGGGLHEDEMYSGANGEGCYCESCFNDNFTYWEGETYHNGECVNVYYLSRYGRTHEFRPYDGFDDIVYSETDREYWQLDDVTWCECISDWIPNDMIGDGYELCTDSGELFPDSEMIEVNGDWYHKELVGLLSVTNGAVSEFILANMDSDAIVETDRVLMGVKVYVLADNYELDDNGTPIRNPELPLAA